MDTPITTPEPQVPATPVNEPTNQPPADPGTPAAETPPADPPKADPPAPAAPPEPIVITDEMFFGELNKRTGEKLKGKEDLDKVLSFNESEYIKPHDERVTKLNQWIAEGKDPKLYLELSELDTDKMDAKEAIIRNTMTRRGISREDASLLFDHKYANAFTEAGQEGFDARAKRLAELEMTEEARNAKQELSQYKVTQMAPAKTGPTQQELQALQERKQKEWDAPVENAIKNLSKIESSLKIKLPDEQEITETFQLGAEVETAKQIVKDLLSDPSQFATKFFNRYGAGKTAQEGFETLARTLMEFELRDDMKSSIASFGASKGVAAHLAKVRPGNLDPSLQKAPDAPALTREQAIEAAMREKLKPKQ